MHQNETVIDSQTCEASEHNALAVEKISRAKAKLLVEFPYFGTLASRLELYQSDNIKAFLSDGMRLEYNDEYVEDAELEELGFALSNGAMHAALAHENRQKGRLKWLWQLATDHAINAMLVQNGMNPPEHINYEERFEGMYAEEIYAVLKDEIQNEEYDDNEENDTGFNEENRRHQQQMQNAEGDHDKDKKRTRMEVENQEQLVNDESRQELDELETLEEQFEQMAKEMLGKMLKRGDLPEGIDRFFEVGTEGKIDWRHELYMAVENHYKNDYRMMPPAKKLLYRGTYLPSLYSDMLRIVIAIDSSGSVDEVLLGTFIAEIESLMLSFSNFQIDLLVCDAKVHSHETFYGGDKLEYVLKGGGGTDFRPVFSYIDEHLPDTRLLLYFTDLDGRAPDGEPLFETVWVSPVEGEMEFGRVLVLGE